ncbi:MAG TPA: four helix bundle protein [Flavisolibacter sp.]
MRDDTENIIVEKTVAFALLIIKYCRQLERKGQLVIARQLLRSGTAIGAHVFEAQNAESRADFIHKMKVGAKEASETKYWLIICEKCDGNDFDYGLPESLQDIIKILSKIISTTKQNYRHNRI